MKSRIHAIAATLAIGALSTSVPPAKAADTLPPPTTIPYQVEIIDVPDASASLSWGLNDAGVVSVLWWDANGKGHGATYSHGRLTPVAEPATGGIIVEKINDRGQITGNIAAASGPRLAGIYEPRRKAWSSLPPIPGKTLNTGAGLNNAGWVAGHSYVGDYSESVSWVWNGRSMDVFTVPQANTANGGTIAWGINNQNVTCGYWVDDNFSAHGFLRKGSTLTQFDVPNTTDTALYGLNDKGTTVGVCDIAADDYRAHGFVYSRGKAVLFDIPDAIHTFLSGVNNQGSIAGGFIGQDGVERVFVAWAPEDEDKAIGDDNHTK